MQSPEYRDKNEDGRSFCVLVFALCRLHPVVRALPSALHSIVCTLSSAPCRPRPAFCSALYRLHSVVCTLSSAPCLLLSTLRAGAPSRSWRDRRGARGPRGRRARPLVAPPAADGPRRNRRTGPGRFAIILVEIFGNSTDRLRHSGPARYPRRARVRSARGLSRVRSAPRRGSGPAPTPPPCGHSRTKTLRPCTPGFARRRGGPDWLRSAPADGFVSRRRIGFGRRRGLASGRGPRRDRAPHIPGSGRISPPDFALLPGLAGSGRIAYLGPPSDATRPGRSAG